MKLMFYNVCVNFIIYIRYKSMFGMFQTIIIIIIIIIITIIISF